MYNEGHRNNDTKSHETVVEMSNILEMPFERRSQQENFLKLHSKNDSFLITF